METSLKDVRSVLAEVRDELFSKPNVVATGIGYKITGGRQTKELAIICSVETKQSAKRLTTKELIPARIQNIPTDVYPTGIIHALQAPTGRFRPAPGGVSIGHIYITAGTLGCLVKKNDKLFILSNNHVLANSNDADIGDAILQPGPYDGGRFPQDQIAKLSEFIPIEFSGDGGGGTNPCPFGRSAAAILNLLASIVGSKTRLRPARIKAKENLVDCAIAEPLSQSDVKNEILQIGTLSGTAEGTLGMQIKKSGRTTGLTSGSILQIDVTVDVSYGSNKTATFVDQLMAGEMSQGGDSGSAVVSEANQLVGLLFAGSSTSTIINRIQNVFQALQVTVP
ncbi:hypothetical protein BMS3Abin05_02176 [bacterium BMS3Abin05]|nr:hypothetical protein BMS3Abin05_02176 [bacterium BMS3Abin05]GBE26669.1 hypothetical protein BMS3Bbin03_00584 [bacterium BMS3Bbin03]